MNLYGYFKVKLNELCILQGNRCYTEEENKMLEELEHILEDKPIKDKKVLSLIMILLQMIPKKKFSDPSLEIYNNRTKQNLGSLKDFIDNTLKECFEVKINWEESLK